MSPLAPIKTSDFADVTIHRSQFPESLDNELVRCLEEHWVNPKFHYLSNLQMRRWISLSRAYAPISLDKDCQVTYDQCFSYLASQWQGRAVHVVGLGCGAGHKDARLASALKRKGVRSGYTACDSSLPMVLTARQTVGGSAGIEVLGGLVCDIGAAPDLEAYLASLKAGLDFRLYLCFGVIPNFEPHRLFLPIRSWMNPGDYLLLGANLVPESQPGHPMDRIITQYDNQLTRGWLLTLFQELDVDPAQCLMTFTAENVHQYEHLLRISATVCMQHSVHLRLGNRDVHVPAQDPIQLFFSYRYTQSQICAVLKNHGLAVHQQWITPSGEEGLFLCSSSFSTQT